MLFLINFLFVILFSLDEECLIKSGIGLVILSKQFSYDQNFVCLPWEYM